MNTLPSDFIIKICGLTNVEDALAAARLGANALGFVFVPGVSRTVEPEAGRALIAQVRQVMGAACPRIVGLFAKQSPEEVRRVAEGCGVDAVQVHGPADADYFRRLRELLPQCQLWKAVAVGHHSPTRLRADLADGDVDGYVLDAPKGGPARTFDWGLATVAQQPDCCRGRPVVLAGGLTAASVAEAITRTRPAGVDVSSGIEAVVRQKDLQEMARFIQQARQAAPRAGRERTTRESRLARIIEAGVVAIVRLSDGGALPQVLSALHAGGVTALEVTFPTPNALEIIADRRERFGGEVGMGVGTVRRPAEAGRAIAAGAEFIVAPHYSPEVLGVCHAHGVPYLPGAATPTEIAAAWDAGADLIKVFPAHTLGGVEYIQALKGPYPEISLCPTGGIDEHNAAEFIQAGSLAFGVGGLLVNDRVVAERKFGEITRRSAQLMAAVQAARR